MLDGRVSIYDHRLKSLGLMSPTVRPWPVYRNMTEQDLRAIYEYLRAIPHAEPGSCTGPGQ